MKKSIFWFKTALIVVLGVQLACNAANPIADSATQTVVPVIPSSTAVVSTPTPSPIPSSTATEMPTSTPTPTPAILITPPAEGKGNIAGLVLWNKKPAPLATVKLCQEFTTYDGCKGVNYSTYTDDNGYYLFKNIIPGEYVLIINVTGTGWWIYSVEGNSPRKETVTLNETLMLDARNIFKVDLRATYPGFGEVVSESSPTFKWEAYPGAAYYQITVSNQDIYSIIKDEKINGNEYTLSKTLLNCEYVWEVEAFNEQGIKIASTKDSQKFVVTGQVAGCKLNLNSPKNLSRVGGKGLELLWEPHPLAGHYTVYVFDNNYNRVVSEDVAGSLSIYSVAKSLKPGTYRWYVVAYDKDDGWIAVSKWFSFTLVGE